MTPVAVDIPSGFLGSGKTTLLGHVVTHSLRGKPVAVIMNEIGEVGIDGRVITALSAVEKMVELPSGCICCSIDEYRFDLAAHHSETQHLAEQCGGRPSTELREWNQASRSAADPEETTAGVHRPYQMARASGLPFPPSR